MDAAVDRVVVHRDDPDAALTTLDRFLDHEPAPWMAAAMAADPRERRS